MKSVRSYSALDLTLNDDKLTSSFVSAMEDWGTRSLVSKGRARSGRNDLALSGLPMFGMIGQALSAWNEHVIVGIFG